MARKSRKKLVAELPVQEDAALTPTGAYIRLSADDTRKQGDSLATQRNIVERHIAASTDLQLVQCYTDNDQTGTNFNRPGFQQMMVDVESGKIRCIIVKDLSRFGRNAIDAGYYLEKYLPAKGVRFIAVNDGFDSSESDGGVLLPIKNILAESYALDIGKKCKAVQRQKMLEGKFIGGRAPYGYIKSSCDNGKLMVDLETAPVVQQIFAWGAEGLTYNEIARRLHKAHILPPSHEKQAKGQLRSDKIIGHGYWTRWTLAGILTNTVYLGHMAQGKMKKVNGRSVRTSPEDWVIVCNTHENLVSQSTFDCVQLQIQQISNHFQNDYTPSVAYSNNMFRGKIYCAHCGMLMRRKRQNKDGTYWFRCESQQKYGQQACEIVSIKEQDLLNVLMVMIHQENRLMTGRYQGLLWQSSVATEDTDLQLTRKEIAQTKRLLQSLYENMVSDIITPEEYTQMKTDYSEKLKALTEKAGDLQEAKSARQQDIEIYGSLTEAITKTLENRTLTAFLVEQLVERIEVHSDKSATIYLKYQKSMEEVS